MATKSTAARSRPIDQCRLPPSPSPPLLPPYPMLPYNHPYVYAPPIGYMPPPPTWYFTPTHPLMGYMPPPPPIWYFTPTQPPMGYMPHPLSPEDLSPKILKQIEYYFSDDNLAKDLFLKMQMDDDGWVPITLIAGFRRVSQLTKDIQIILDSLKNSDTVEVQGDKLRRRTTWKKWLICRSIKQHSINVVPSDGVSSKEES